MTKARKLRAPKMLAPCWMWEKMINGKMLLTDSETALRHEMETADEE